MTNGEPGPPETTADADVAELAAQVRSSVARLYRRVRSQLPIGELGETAIAVLTWLHDEGPQTLTALSEAFRVAPASMSQTVNRLTAGGYATRAPDPTDGRRVQLAVTAAGSRLAQASRARRHAWMQARVAALSREDRATLARAAVLLDVLAADGPSEGARADRVRGRAGAPG